METTKVILTKGSVIKAAKDCVATDNDLLEIIASDCWLTHLKILSF